MLIKAAVRDSIWLRAASKRDVLQCKKTIVLAFYGSKQVDWIELKVKYWLLFGENCNKNSTKET